MIMIALGGTIGIGLFLASRTALSTARPVGSLVSYLLILVMVYFVIISLGNETYIWFKLIFNRWNIFLFTEINNSRR